MNFTRYNSDTSGTYVRLRWTDASDDETGFRVEYKKPSDDVWTLVETTKANATGALVYGVEAGVDYQWRVRSERGAASSSWTEGTFYALSSPSDVAVVNYDATQGSATLTWADTDESLTGYRVEISTVPFASSSVSPSSSTCQVYVVGDVTSCDFKVVSGTTYYCRVRSYGATGSAIWTETTFEAELALFAPTLSVKAVDSSKLTLSLGMVANAAGYVYEYASTADFVDATQVSVGGSGTFTLSGLSANTTYYFRAKSVGVDGYGDSAWSETVSATTAGSDTPSTVVTTNLDVVDPNDGEISLREAIQNAVEGDAITFAASLKGQTITLSGTELAITKGVTIDASALYDAENDVPGITVNANYRSRVFNVSGGTAENPAAFVGLTITGGKSDDYGGGVYGASNTTLTFADCAISGNTASAGGGVYVDGNQTTLTFVNCSISGNTATGSWGAGGGICSFADTLTLTDCAINGNTGSDGGGIYAFGTTTLTFANCSISGNTAGSCGGIYADNATTTFTNCSISGNTASAGGGVFAWGATTFANCSISGNTASFGGGVYAWGATTFTNCSISENTAAVVWGDGGGIYAFGTATFTNCSISDNTAGSEGGGIYVDGLTTLTLTNCSISDNTAESGGGIYANGTTTLTNCFISGNTAATGGGIYTDETTTLTNCSISGNTANNGGGIYVGHATTTFTNCSISGNTANNGGGIYVDFATTTFTNCSISGNTATGSWRAGGGIYLRHNCVVWLRNTILALNTNDIYADYASGYTYTINAYNTLSSFTDWSNASESGVANYVYDASLPLFADAANGDYTLAENSQALDKGNDAYAVDTEGNALQTDLAGNRRFSGSSVDLGAYELLSGLKVTTNLDVVDETDGVLSLREAIQAAEPGDAITFAPSLKGATITLSGTELAITKGLTVDASSLYDAENDVPGLTINADGKSRVFNVSGGTAETPVELIGLTITGGYNASAGGGVYALNRVDFEHCVFSANKNSTGYFGDSAKTFGGGVYVGGVSEFEGCRFEQNVSDGGGGAYVRGSATFTNTLFVKNSGRYGGALFTDYAASSVDLRNCVVAVNTVGGGSGGGIACFAGAIEVYNAIVTGNTGYSGRGDVYGAVKAHNTLSSYTAWSNASESGVANYVYDASLPLFADAANGNYTLAVNSQAINKGNDAYAVDAEGNALQTDLAGNARISGSSVDLGAYEFDASLLETPSLVVTTAEDVVDYTDGKISLREAIQYAVEGDSITFDASLKGATITLSGTELAITKGITVDASALYDAENDVPGLTINAAGKSRVFNVSGGTVETPVELIGLTITGGKMSGNGGGLLASGVLNASYCRVVENTGAIGGGVSVDGDGTVNLLTCVISDNMATQAGGGFYSLGTTTLTNVLITGNYMTEQRYWGGAGFYADYGTSVFYNCTIAGNSSKMYAGGIRVNYATVAMYNTIVVQNIGAASNNGDISFCNVATRTTAYNVLSSYTAWSNASESGVANYVYDASLPLFADAANGNYTLAVNSQAINKGNDAYAVDAEGNALQTDLAGNARISGSSVDLGAYEFDASLLETPSLVVTTAEDVVDYTDGKISLREAIQYAVEGDSITFDASLKGATITLSGTELAIVKGITIDASSLYDAENDVPGLTINADGKSRVFNVSGGTAENPVELIGLTVTGAYGDLGGAFYSTGVLSVASCRVVGNTAVRAGGGFYSLGTTTIENCTISDNTTTEAGGGFYSLGTATLANVLIANNKTTSYYGGGGCYFDAGAATLRNCTIVGNYGIYGGGLRANVPATLYNTIVAQNTGSNGDVFIYHSGRLTAYNVLSSYTAWAAGSNNYVYNVSLPLFTDAANGDYTLAVNSQAFDKGNDAYAVDAQGNPLTTDLSGNARISGSSVDLGAYEFDASLLETPSLVVTTAEDVVDYTDGKISLREAIQYAVEGDSITFDASLKGATITLSGTELAIVKGITIDASSLYDAENDVPGLTLNADGKSRVFNVSGGTAETPVELIGLTVTGGYRPNGVAIDNCGGGILTSGVLNASYCRVVGNTGSGGGGVCVDIGGAVNLLTCVVSDNTATQAGGGFYSWGAATLTNVLLSGNKTPAYYGGGGCYFKGGSATLRHCAIVDNSGIYGGGIRADAPTTLYNTIVAQNTATSSGADFYVAGSGKLTAYNVLSSYTAWSNASESGVTNYIYDASLPLFTDAANGDYTLAEGSQAINKGNDAYAVDAQGNPLTTDLAGNSRFSGSSVDLGAYEYTSPSVAPETIRTIGDVSAAFGETVEINLAQYFSDGDWTYSVKTPETLSDALVVAPVVEGDVLTLKFLAQANYLLDLDLSDVELVVVASTADGSASVDSNVFTVGLTDRYSARLAAVLTGLTTDDAYDYEMGKGRNKYYGAEEIPASDAANVVAGSPISLQLWSEDLSAKHGLTLESNVAFTFVLTLENATLDLNDTYGDDGYYAEFFGATGSYVKTSEDAGYEALGENEYWISVLYNYREKAHGVQTPATLLASLPVIPNGEGAVSATLQPWTDVRDPLVYRCFNGVSCEVDRSQVELLGASSADVVSEAFAELFVEEDAEDDFWFELEKALGNRR